MGRSLDYESAKLVLAEEFDRAERNIQDGETLEVPPQIAASTERLFSSATQAFREALVGCAVAKILDPEIDIRLPYMNQGESAFNGRTLDERVVNPFLHDHSIPCSKGPYLSALRRNIRFEPETARGLRDREAYTAFLKFIGELERADGSTARLYLRYLLYTFLKLREASHITVSRVRRLSLEQYSRLLDGLLAVPSGGLMPVLFAVAMLQTLKRCFGLDWEIEWQGINVSDRATGVGGDIVIKTRDTIVLAVEVTERVVDRARVISTFSSKISPQAIEDYLFLFTSALPTDDARKAAQEYFAQGHEIVFAQMREWILNGLVTIGHLCREMFTSELVGLLDVRQVPAALKVAWNDQVRGLFAASS
jgi:hypothetical protein